MSNKEPVMHYKWLLYCYLLSIKLLSDPLSQSINFSPILKDTARSIGLMHTMQPHRPLLLMPTVCVKTCGLHAYYAEELI